MIIYLIRHAHTAGNLERRYVGCTDEPLCDAAAQICCAQSLPDRIYTSPMLRAVQTAELLYPGRTPVQISMLRECDFGDFEYRTYEELRDNPDYQKWIAGEGEAPGGESRADFQARCQAGFRLLVRDAFAAQAQTTAVITHGGVIMSIMETFARPGKGSFYDWQAANVGGWVIEADRDSWLKRECVRPIGKWPDMARV